MQASEIPTKFSVVFAASAGAGYIRSIPTTPSGQPGAAALTTGFPPVNFIPEGAGGVPPFGEDLNGIINQISAWCQWFAGGGAPVTYDATFQTAIGGYWNGSVVGSATTPGVYWRSTVDNNTTDPDTGGAGWVSFLPNAVAVVGTAQGVTGSSGGGAKTATFAAQEIIAETTLGGTAFKSTNPLLTFNGATTGAGGMDTGSLPVSGNLSIYLIFNPTTMTWALLGCLGSTSNGPVYTGANIPTGYTASVLISSLRTDGSANIVAFTQMDRSIDIAFVEVLSGGGANSYTAVSCAGAVPANARTVSGNFFSASVSSPQNFYVASTSTGLGAQVIQAFGSGIDFLGAFIEIKMPTAQTIYYQIQPGGSGNIYVTSYTF